MTATRFGLAPCLAVMLGMAPAAAEPEAVAPPTDIPDPGTAASNRRIADNLSAITQQNAAALAAHARLEQDIAARNAAAQAAYAATLSAWEADAARKRQAFADWEQASRSKAAPARNVPQTRAVSSAPDGAADVGSTICRSLPHQADTGTRIGGRSTRLCLTRAEWKQRDHATSKDDGRSPGMGALCTASRC